MKKSTLDWIEFGMGMCFVLSVLFLILKVHGIIDWSFWMCLSPILFVVLIALVEWVLIKILKL